MCIICVSPKGVRQPSKEEIYAMFVNNPHGAGYMVARNGKVEYHKGFMSALDLMGALLFEDFGEDDVVAYHFRISTQAGTTPGMTHPFPISKSLEKMGMLDGKVSMAIMHNGIIPCTTDHSNRRYSDTALFAARVLPYYVRSGRDLTEKTLDDMCRDAWNWQKNNPDGFGK